MVSFTLYRKAFLKSFSQSFTTELSTASSVVNNFTNWAPHNYYSLISGIITHFPCQFSHYSSFYSIKHGDHHSFKKLAIFGYFITIIATTTMLVSNHPPLVKSLIMFYCVFVRMKKFVGSLKCHNDLRMNFFYFAGQILY